MERPSPNGAFVCRAAFTLDGGTGWTSGVSTPTHAAGDASADPSVAADAQGNFYVTWIAFRRAPGGQASDFVLYVAKALAGSLGFASQMAGT